MCVTVGPWSRYDPKPEPKKAVPQDLSTFEKWYNSYFSNTPVNTQHINDCEAAWNAAIRTASFDRERHADEYFALGAKSAAELDALEAFGAEMAAAADAKHRKANDEHG
jgi:hypothetical protein